MVVVMGKGERAHVEHMAKESSQKPRTGGALAEVGLGEGAAGGDGRGLHLLHGVPEALVHRVQQPQLFIGVGSSFGM